MIRFDTTNDRGPSGSLWGRLVDWVRGTLAVQGGVLDGTDHFPYEGPNATADSFKGGMLLSADTGSVAVASAVPFGVVSFTATAGTYAVAGYARNCYIDFTDIREVCREVRFSRTAGATGEERSFIGFSDQAVEAIFHSDGTLDGGSSEEQLGLLWKNDLAVDLVSVVDGTATVLLADVATGVSNTGFHKFGLRVRKENAARYTIFPSVDGVVKKVSVLSTAISPDAMRPVVATSISATDAPTGAVDWDFTLDATPA